MSAYDDHVSLDELSEALREHYPRITANEIDHLVLALWARIISKRAGLMIA